MAKTHTEYDYSEEELDRVSDDEFAKSLVHGAEVQEGAYRRRDHSLLERMKVKRMMAEDAQASDGVAMVRNRVRRCKP